MQTQAGGSTWLQKHKVTKDRQRQRSQKSHLVSPTHPQPCETEGFICAEWMAIQFRTSLVLSLFNAGQSEHTSGPREILCLLHFDSAITLGCHLHFRQVFSNSIFAPGRYSFTPSVYTLCLGTTQKNGRVSRTGSVTISRPLQQRSKPTFQLAIKNTGGKASCQRVLA